MKSLSRVWLFVTLWTVAYQASASMGFSRQEYWSGLPFPSPGDLPDPGIEPRSPALQADALTPEPPGKFYSSHVWMWESDCKESWALRNWCLCTVMLEKTVESPLDCKEIKPVHPKGNQSWIFIGRTDAEAEVSILWSPGANSWLIGKTCMLGKIEGRMRRVP